MMSSGKNDVSIKFDASATCDVTVRVLNKALPPADTQMARKLTDIVSHSLRIREGLRRRLERDAKTHNQSLNAEIVDRLDQSFELTERQAQYDALLSFAAAGNKDDARLLKLIASAMWKLRTGPKRL